jgi:hypothetical protein
MFHVRLFIISVFLFLINFQVSGQLHRWDGDTVPLEVTGRHYMMAGVDWIDVDDLNETLNERGLQDFSTYALGLGWGWDMTYGRILSGGALNGTFWRANETSGTRSTFWAGKLMFNAGFQLLNSQQFFLYPVVGIGGGMGNLVIGPDEVPFNTAISQPDPSFSAHQYSFLINLGGGLDLLSQQWRMHKNMLIGIRAGYIIDPFRSTTWYRNRTTVTGGPDSRLQGPYVHLVLGKAHSWRSARMERIRNWRNGNGI